MFGLGLGLGIGVGVRVGLGLGLELGLGLGLGLASPNPNPNPNLLVEARELRPGSSHVVSLLAELLHPVTEVGVVLPLLGAQLVEPRLPLPLQLVRL